MPLSERNQGYSVAESKSRPATNLKTAHTNGVDPQFSEFGDIKPIRRDKVDHEPRQPRVGYHRTH